MNTEPPAAIGVDGCRGGWVVAILDLGQPLRFHLAPTLRTVVSEWPDSPIAVDMPIGLAAGQPRGCDREARQVLGPRRSSVFPSPDRRLLASESYEQVRLCARELDVACPSKQTYYLMPKIREADALLTVRLQHRLFEAHPEVCFWAANHASPMAFSKATPEGYRERRRVLRRALPGSRIPLRQTASRLLGATVKPDDILDAAILAWTAARWAAGAAERFPRIPERDPRGLRMEIVY